MVNFELVLEMAELIAQGNIPKSMNFNEFCIKFYLETKVIPLSKFLRMKGFSNKMPKIMNTRKAGEVLFESKSNTEILELIKKEGYPNLDPMSRTIKKRV